MPALGARHQNARSAVTAVRTGSTEKTWLKHYPAGVPAEVKTDLYASLVALLEESFRKYRNLPAYKFMGRPTSAKNCV